MGLKVTKPTPKSGAASLGTLSNPEVTHEQKLGGHAHLDEQRDAELKKSIRARAEKLAEQDERAQLEETTAKKDAPPRPKTSPIPRRGDLVIFRTQEKALKCNGTADHVAVVVRKWSDTTLNLHVLPDCGDAYCATSVQRIHPDNLEATGWFTLGEASDE